MSIHIRHRFIVYTIALVSIFDNSISSVKADTHHQLSVGVHEDVQVDETIKVDRQVLEKVLARVNKITQSDFIEDYACSDLVFKLESMTIVSNNLPSIIRTQADFDAYQSSPYTVHIVEAIDWCGGSTPNPQAIGCARRGGPLLVERYFRPLVESVAWVHEFGHTQGLSKDTDGNPHSTRDRAIMRAGIGERTLGLTQAECNILVKPSTIARSEVFATKLVVAANGQAVEPTEALAVAASPSEPGLGGNEVPLSADVSDLIGNVYENGVPVDASLSLSDVELNEIRQIVDRQESDYLPNAVIVLGQAGDAADGPRLINLLSSEASPATREAKLLVPLALGYLAARTQDLGLVDFLTKHTQPSAAAGFFSGDAFIKQKYAERFAGAALTGLAFSGARAVTARSKSPDPSSASTDRSSAAAALSQMSPVAIEDEAKEQINEAAAGLGLPTEHLENLHNLSSDVSALGLVEVLRRQQQTTPDP